MSAAYMTDIIKAVIQSYGREVGDIARAKVCNYISLMTSAGKTEEQLVALGRAYLEQIAHPDPRYSGC